ncbi:adenosylcobinamide-phosphate synthase CbiB [Thiomicrospira sp. ALE5]|uniref:adenosylcobinamide-phosphate synthase CbiB n=1 Tax=Thiomicrospira sp. ALE5 TaxID=748650 RepID=UPI0008E7C77D|nr:adenosylcobinamide-phosphate synthase CbiB [Thiomicrospira sp. ALE5]SFR58830.1 adenosylcobinamide-phosphate synthase [Thiomicrospira sp. ALE5]
MLIFDPLTILLIALLALLIDRLCGEFLNRTHPVVFIGKLISLFEKWFYLDSRLRGGLLVIWVLTLCGLATFALVYLLNAMTNSLHPTLALLLSALFASTLLAHRMLYDSVNALQNHPHPQQAVAMLVSRDTADLCHSDCYKAGIESYAENLSDGLVAPLFYLLLFGLPGLVIYKAINTLDSMVGYRTPRYERFGKIAARLDDLANWIPARLTAGLILLLGRQAAAKNVWQQARGHDSPNAGYPISAMAWVIKAQLGGPTRYFGELKAKPYFGPAQASREIDLKHLQTALALRNRIDGSLLLVISMIGIISYAFY